jgi:hypothetical protein
VFGFSRRSDVHALDVLILCSYPTTLSGHLGTREAFLLAITVEHQAVRAAHFKRSKKQAS